MKKYSQGSFKALRWINYCVFDVVKDRLEINSLIFQDKGKSKLII
jgi:hypothetical protein